MNTTIEYLEAIKDKTGATSDYKLAQILEVSRQQMSKYRTRGEQFSDETCLKVAAILEIDPLIVMTAIQLEKAKGDEVKAAWQSLLHRLGGVAATLLIATGINVATPSPANAGAALMGSDTSGTMYIMLNNKRRKPRKLKRKIDLSFLIGNMLQAA